VLVVIEARYHRHELIDWFSQDAIARTKVAVIGAGAVGNEVIKNLALLDYLAF
jgi:molybdopterin-synthase adenylyltransferase